MKFATMFIVILVLFASSILVSGCTSSGGSSNNTPTAQPTSSATPTPTATATPTPKADPIVGNWSYKAQGETVTYSFDSTGSWKCYDNGSFYNNGTWTFLSDEKYNLVGPNRSAIITMQANGTYWNEAQYPDETFVKQ